MTDETPKRDGFKTFMSNPTRRVKAFLMEDGSVCLEFKTLHQPRQRIRLSRDAFWGAVAMVGQLEAKAEPNSGRVIDLNEPPRSHHLTVMGSLSYGKVVPDNETDC